MQTTGAPFCSRVARAAGFQPVGTAPTYQAHLLVECPLPWEREVTDSDTFPAALRELLARAAQDGIEPRVTGIMPDPEYAQAGLTRVFFFAHSADAPVYAKREFLVPPGEAPALVEALLYAPGGVGRFGAYEQKTEHVREVLVCNHGSRDRCCATFGFPVYQELRRRYARPDSVRVWRCSHLGGHRMAPTLLDLPEGRYYAYVAVDDLPNLIGREGPFAALADQYRGWGRLSPLEQAAERAVLLAEGWQWTAHRVHSDVAPDGEDGTVKVTLAYTGLDAAPVGRYRIVVREAPERLLRFPSSCGKVDEPQPQFVVERVEKLP